MFEFKNIVNQEIALPKTNNIELFLKREDLVHPFISGNKYRKLKYNIEEAKRLDLQTLLTFGGAFSNHLAAVAYAGHKFGLKTIGVVRGDELSGELTSPTLVFCKNHGMVFKFVSREVYRNKTSHRFLNDLEKEFHDFYLISEGGTNTLAVKGCEEILTKKDAYFDYICVPVGTGGTISGLINCSQPRQQVLGFPALKGSFLHEDISKFASKDNWKLVADYHFGGYAKINEELIRFINEFKKRQHIPLDPIYTGKMMFGIFDLIEKDFFPKGSKILAIHTGGLQGIAGMNIKLKQKGFPLIET